MPPSQEFFGVSLLVRGSGVFLQERSPLVRARLCLAQHPERTNQYQLCINPLGRLWHFLGRGGRWWPLAWVAQPPLAITFCCYLLGSQSSV